MLMADGTSRGCRRIEVPAKDPPMESLPTLRRFSFPLPAPLHTALFCLGLVLLFLGMALGLPAERAIDLGAIWSDAVLLLCGTAALYRSRCAGERPRAWLLFSASFFLSFASTFFAERLGFSGSEGLLVLGRLLRVLAILDWFHDPRERRRLLSRLLEGALFGLSMLALSWEALMHLPDGPFSDLWYRLVFSHGIRAASLGIVVFQGRSNVRRLNGPVGLVGIAFLLNLVASVHVSLAPLQADYIPPLYALILGPISQLCCLAAALVPWADGAKDPEDRSVAHPWFDALVYLPFVVALGWMILSAWRWGRVAPAVLVLMGVLTLLLLLRQLLALRDQSRFSSVLGEKLEERTRNLEELQNLLLRNQKMNMMAMVGAGLAHDFNNQLTLLMAQVETGDKGAALATAMRAAEMGRRLMSLGRDERTVAFFDLGDLVRQRQKLFRHLASAGVDLDLAPVEEGCWMEADPLEIEQILVNLITNARDAMAGRGHLQVGTSRTGDTVRLWVADRGPGMDEATQARIFQPFFTTKQAGKGTGLGLASVRTIVEGLKGTIQVESSPGKGTVFTLSFPCALTESEEKGRS